MFFLQKQNQCQALDSAAQDRETAVEHQKLIYISHWGNDRTESWMNGPHRAQCFHQAFVTCLQIVLLQEEWVASSSGNWKVKHVKLKNSPVDVSGQHDLTTKSG